MGELREAAYWSVEGERVRCALCPHHCLIAEGKQGLCGVRGNRGGRLRALTYGVVTAANLDPIEKKPLYHFHPGSAILSLGSWGCNLSCDFCQNWHISTGEVPGSHLSPQEAADLAVREERRGNIGISYTYNEPLIWFEYVLDTSRLVRERGLKNVLVTNGEIEEGPLEELLPYIDAMNVDIKAMADDFYRRLCHGPGSVPRRTVERALGRCHVEVTNLLIPGENDSAEQVGALVDWVAGLSDRIPVHFSRYHPAHKMTKPPTPLASLEQAYRIASEKLKYVYVGNARLPNASDTRCPSCGAVVVERDGFSASPPRLSDGRCGECGSEVDLVT
ncbi:MAG: AmmeMemoRadiSam system radical SAM enzyme [Armatimonadetes bacterium]|nr:AmmeMemoRadiSam system radical SAM enzyme [Armatimonadota bacterium]